MTAPRPRPTNRRHQCGAPGCTEAVPHRHIMCRAHWMRTPRHLREAITSAWEAGRTGDWSTAILEARTWHRDNPPAALAARITGDRS